MPYQFIIDPDDLIIKLTACCRQTVVVQFFCEVCTSIRICRDSFKANPKTSGKMEETEYYILEYYMNQNLSANFLSEKYGISSN